MSVPNQAHTDLRCRPLGLTDRPALVQLLADDAGYSDRVHNRPATPADAEDVLTARPPTLADDRKHVLGLFDGGRLVGVADVLRGYPAAEYAYIGLLQVAARRHGEGLGRVLHTHVLEMVQDWPEVLTVRLAVAEPNAAQADPFWRRLGYEPTGEVRPWGDIAAHIWQLPVPRH